MIVERNKNEIVVRFEMGKNASRVQTILDYLRYEELTSKSATTQKDVNKLTKETKKGRWDRIKKEVGLN